LGLAATQLLLLRCTASMLAGTHFKPHTALSTCRSNHIKPYKAAQGWERVAARRNRRISAQSDQSIDKEELSQLLGEQFLTSQYDDYSDEHVRGSACAGVSNDSLAAAAAVAIAVAVAATATPLSTSGVAAA
jgi:hypothetical protein